MIDNEKFYEFITNSLSVNEMKKVEHELLADEEGQAIIHALCSSYETNKEQAIELLGDDIFIDRNDVHVGSKLVEQTKIKSIMKQTSFYEFTSMQKDAFEVMVANVQNRMGDEQKLIEFIVSEAGVSEAEARKAYADLQTGLSNKFDFTAENLSKEEIIVFLNKVNSDYASENNDFLAKVYSGLVPMKEGMTIADAKELEEEYRKISPENLMDMIANKLLETSSTEISDAEVEKFVDLCRKNVSCDENHLKALSISCYILFKKKGLNPNAQFIGQSVATYDGLIKGVADTPETMKEQLIRYAKIALTVIAMIAVAALAAYFTAVVVGYFILAMQAAMVATGGLSLLLLLFGLLSGTIYLGAVAAWWGIVLWVEEGLVDIYDSLNAPKDGEKSTILSIREEKEDGQEQSEDDKVRTGDNRENVIEEEEDEEEDEENFN